MHTTRAALTAIGAYQRYISPYKGFCCAHAAFFGGPSCSRAVRDIVQEHGVAGGWALIQARFAACRQAHAHLRAAPLAVGTTGFTPTTPGSGSVRARGVFCCGPIPIPFRCG